VVHGQRASPRFAHRVRSRTPPHRWFLPLHRWPWRGFPRLTKPALRTQPMPRL
jgi:hypothetical protein